MHPPLSIDVPAGQPLLYPCKCMCLFSRRRRWLRCRPGSDERYRHGLPAGSKVVNSARHSALGVILPSSKCAAVVVRGSQEVCRADLAQSRGAAAAALGRAVLRDGLGVPVEHAQEGGGAAAEAGL